jgi:hypothetical protein
VREEDAAVGIGDPAAGGTEGGRRDDRAGRRERDGGRKRGEREQEGDGACDPVDRNRRAWESAVSRRRLE